MVKLPAAKIKWEERMEMEQQDKGNVVKKTFTYTRMEDEEKTVIVSRTEFTYLLYFFLLLILAGSMLRGSYWFISFVGCAGMVAQWIYSFITMKNVNAEIREASGKGLVTVSSNKVSMRDPMTITIMHAHTGGSGELDPAKRKEPEDGDFQETIAAKKEKADSSAEEPGLQQESHE